ncbi:universal stress protein [Coralliovum pocilloporae]|uniref:universal stress protein n=1 Tax=Coralliovum pocilloporae TaxID=3066369 RepID=UPI00330714F5
MFRTILVPVDVEHKDKMEKAQQVAADLARQYGSKIHIVGVAAFASGKDDYTAKLEYYAGELAERHDMEFVPHAVICHDLGAELVRMLSEQVDELDVDLVVMASHAPGFMDHFFSSNANLLTAHIDRSVLVVR